MSEIFMDGKWVFWVVSIFAVVAAYIDGKELRVPNKLTFPMIIAGWIFSMVSYGMSGDGWYMGLMWSLLGTAAGLCTLLPAYAVGGMGAGDAKMMAAIGAWVHTTIVFYSFCVGTVVGGILAVIMIVSSGDVMKHYTQFWMILNEFQTVRDPEKLAKIATERKTQMRLLPYGIPMAIGTVLYLAWMGMLV
jgi:prepilin peptidase CpaA